MIWIEKKLGPSRCPECGERTRKYGSFFEGTGDECPLHGGVKAVRKVESFQAHFGPNEYASVFASEATTEAEAIAKLEKKIEQWRQEKEAL